MYSDKSGTKREIVLIYVLKDCGIYFNFYSVGKEKKLAERNVGVETCPKLFKYIEGMFLFYFILFFSSSDPYLIF